MYSVNPTYKNVVTPEEMQQVFTAARNVKHLVPDLMRVTATCTAMMKVDSRNHAAVAKAAQKAQEAAEALAVLQAYLETVTEELA